MRKARVKRWFVRSGGVGDPRTKVRRKDVGNDTAKIGVQVRGNWERKKRQERRAKREKTREKESEREKKAKERGREKEREREREKDGGSERRLGGFMSNERQEKRLKPLLGCCGLLPQVIVTYLLCPCMQIAVAAGSPRSVACLISSTSCFTCLRASTEALQPTHSVETKNCHEVESAVSTRRPQPRLNNNQAHPARRKKKRVLQPFGNSSDDPWKACGKMQKTRNKKRKIISKQTDRCWRSWQTCK